LSSILNAALKTICFLCSPVGMRISNGWTVCAWIIFRYAVWVQARIQNTDDKSKYCRLRTKYSFGVKSGLNPRHLRFLQRYCCRLECASQITAESIAKAIMVVGLSWLRNVHISPARAPACSAKAMGFSSDQRFLMPRNVWSCHEDWSDSVNRSMDRACVVVWVSIIVIDMTICLHFSSLSAFSFPICFA
jgi:hypothetical protein